jgi:DNA-binding MarR family transcriptional regulator
MLIHPPITDGLISRAEIYREDALNCHVTAVRSASRNLTNLYDRVLAPSGLLATQRTLMLHVAAEPGVSIGELARTLVVEKSAVKRNTTPLVDAGYLTVSIPPEDGRSRRLTLTEKGEALLWETRPRWLLAQYIYEAALGDEEALEFNALAREVSKLPLEHRELSDAFR